MGCWGALSGALVLVVGCGGATERSGQSERTTTTQDVPERRPRGSMSPANQEITSTDARGAIESITPEEAAPGYPVSRVVIAGQAPVAERSFVIALPDEVAIPFAVGDSIVLSIATEPGPPTWQPMNLVVTTDGGELLAMSGVTAPPGWTFERAGEVRRQDYGGYDEVDYHVALSHAGQRVVTEDGHWRRLAASDGGWWVAASATDLEGSELPPDGGPSWSMMIVRAR